MKKTILISLLFIGFQTTVFSQNGNDFKLCDQGKMQPYYFPELKYDGDLLATTSNFKNNFNIKKWSDLTSNSGITTIQFQVNCKGETGNFLIKMIDFDFKESEINEVIVNEILVFTKGLNKWIPAIDEDGKIVNSHKFLTFKIVNSKITEIYPT